MIPPQVLAKCFWIIGGAFIALGLIETEKEKRRVRSEKPPAHPAAKPRLVKEPEVEPEIGPEVEPEIGPEVEPEIEPEPFGQIDPAQKT